MTRSAHLRTAKKRWRRLSYVFLGLLPLLGLFHAVMWSGFTRTLFRPETGDLKRIGYLVGLEDRKLKLEEQEPMTGYTLLGAQEMAAAKEVPVVIFGDSYAPSLAKAVGLKSHEPVGLARMNWEDNNGLSQMKRWLADDWFHRHGVHTIIVERAEYAWLDTFADEGDASLDIPWEKSLESETAPTYHKAPRWTFANNGNFKVVTCNLAYLFSPTAFKMTDTCVVRLERNFFNCSYGNKLLFYRGDLKGALNDRNQPRLEKALRNLQDLAEECRRQGMQFRLIVPPSKSYLYYDWVDRPFYPDSKLLEALQGRAQGSGYVDVKQLFHRRLAEGYQDLYYPDDAHWNFPAAQMAADELSGAEAQR